MYYKTDDMQEVRRPQNDGRKRQQKGFHLQMIAVANFFYLRQFVLYFKLPTNKVKSILRFNPLFKRV